MFQVTFTFLPEACYKERFVLTPKQIVAYMEKFYIKKLVQTIKVKINAVTKARLLSSGTDRSINRPQQTEREGEGKDDVGSEGEEDIEEEGDGDDGDAAAVKEKNKKNEEQEYENGEDENNYNNEEEIDDGDGKLS